MDGQLLRVSCRLFADEPDAEELRALPAEDVHWAPFEAPPREHERVRIDRARYGVAAAVGA